MIKLSQIIANLQAENTNLKAQLGKIDNTMNEMVRSFTELSRDVAKIRKQKKIKKPFEIR